MSSGRLMLAGHASERIAAVQIPRERIIMFPTTRACRLATLIAIGLSASMSVSAQAPAQTSDNAKPATPPRIIGQPTKQLPHFIQGGFDLPNGWRITPAGKPIAELNDPAVLSDDDRNPDD